MFSPARIWPLSWSLSSHAVAVTGGGGGVGSASAGSAAAAAAGAGPGRGASCANANPRSQVASAVTAKRRKAAVDLIELGTPVVRSSVAGRGGTPTTRRGRDGDGTV